MKVTANTPDMLIVEDRPIFIAIMLTVLTLVFVGAGVGLLLAGELWGLMFAGLGGGIGFLFLFLFVRRVQVIFHLPERYVEIRRKNLFRARKVRHRLDEVSRAILETSRTDGTTTYRVTLVIEGESAGRHPITLAYSNVGRHRECAAAINDWLDAVRAARPVAS
jgi:Na+-transporting methylmalonyl-CoA/oxaloacetate decarboxylase gamma subunit